MNVLKWSLSIWGKNAFGLCWEKRILSVGPGYEADILLTLQILGFPFLTCLLGYFLTSSAFCCILLLYVEDNIANIPTPLLTGVLNRLVLVLQKNKFR